MSTVTLIKHEITPTYGSQDLAAEELLLTEGFTLMDAMSAFEVRNVLILFYVCVFIEWRVRSANREWIVA